jgi:prepilin-type processing-associated H-X9-DG protein
MQEQNNLKQIALAMHNFHNAHKAFPMGVAYRDPEERRPLLSWRVALLPYVEERALFERFKLDERWDGPNNIKLLSSVPRVYQRPGQTPSGDGLTHYLAMAGPGTVFDEEFNGARTLPGSPLRLGLRITDIRDGTSNTVMVVTAAQGVPWTKPDDFDVSAGPIGPRLDTRFGGTNVAFADGSVRLLKERGEAQWQALMSAAGGEAVDRE